MEFQFRLVAEFTDGSYKNSDYFFVITTSFKNSPPRFAEELETQAVVIGQKLKWQFPEIIDDEGDKLKDIIVTPSLPWFILDFVHKTMTVDATLLIKDDAGIHDLKITLTDEFFASETFKQTVVLIFDELNADSESESESASKLNSKPGTSSTSSTKS
jgi:hypothetical protein